jgi:carboxynorspermidine decarboxylase
MRLRRNLALIKSVKERAGVEIIMAFKAFAAWKVFPIIREYIGYTTASSLSEARLAMEEMGSKAHTYAPVYTEAEFPEIAACSSHITFNSLAQFEKFHSQLSTLNSQLSCGLRINPEVSVVETDLYNPAKAGSRLGIVADNLPDTLPTGIEGLHFHVLCESSSYDLEKVLTVVEEKFGKYFPQLKWLNMGGGHLMTREDYDVEHLVNLLQNFRKKYPQLQLILEPGAAFVWQTGELVATVQDIVENRGVGTAMLDVSFACHMPDCLEMPYQPVILGAEICENDRHCGLDPQSHKNQEIAGQARNDDYRYRMGGNSCLSGDFVGNWAFDHELQVGEKIIFLDMIHYTTVKTTMFNGVSHPAIALWTRENRLEMLRTFDYEDYKNRMC